MTVFETSSALADGADNKPDAAKAVMKTEAKTIVDESGETLQD